MTDLHAQLEDWLAKSGYPLEMRVASVLRKTGFLPIQSETYQDPVDAKPREVDVVGYLHHLPVEKPRPQGLHEVHFALVCECKFSPDKPWVLFTAARDGVNSVAQIQQIAASKLGKGLLVPSSEAARLQNMPFFQGPPRLGYSVTTAFGRDDDKDKDRAYDALRSVAHATRGIMDHYSTLQVGKPAFAWPVVVLEGRLFECYLGVDEDPQLLEIEYGLLAWRNRILGFHSFVHVVTFSGFAAFSQRALIAAKTLLEYSYLAQKRT